MLAWVAAQTERIDVGSAILQIPARTPAMTAMTAATLDTLSGGRFRLGLGVSGPQVSEGWHGVRFDKPLARTREYVEIVKLALRPRDGRATTASTTRCRCPTARASRCELTVHPAREHIPLYLAAVGPKNLELTGEIADGWLAIFFAPEYAGEQLAQHRRPGRAKAGATLDGFDVVPDACRWSSATTSQACADPSAPTPRCTSAAWAAASRTSTTSSPSGWGTTTQAARGPGPVPGRDTRAPPPPCRSSSSTGPSLLGPLERIADRLQAYAEAGVTTLTVATYAGTLEEQARHAAHDGRGARRSRVWQTDAVTCFEAIVLGIVQGLTEFLPVSSTGAPAHRPRVLLGWDDPGAAFTAVIQLGTMAAVSLLPRRTSGASRATWFRGLCRPEPPRHASTPGWAGTSSSARSRSRSSAWCSRTRSRPARATCALIGCGADRARRRAAGSPSRSAAQRRTIADLDLARRHPRSASRRRSR